MHWIATLLASASLASAQLIAYESFSGMPTSGGISGSGADATGWTQSSWQGATAPYHSIGNQAPAMSYQITNGGLVNGGDSCAVISTAPEPTTTEVAFSRTMIPVNTTLYFSFLLRPLTIGTGSDFIRFAIKSGGAQLLAVGLLPDQGQTYLGLYADEIGTSGSGYSGLNPLYTGSTYFIAGRITRSSSTSTKIEIRLNPSAAFVDSWNQSNSDGSQPSTYDRISISAYSEDTGGPSTSVAIDEIRVGYTWNDVVPKSTTQTVVPTLSIAPAIAVNWQSKTNKSYQPQRSYDMINWTDFGATISGNGQQRNFLDSADQVPKSFYRVIER